MEHPARAIARDLAGQAERVCRRYLSNGQREGNYWLVGDLRNKRGRSLYVRLQDRIDGTGSAGKWTDAQSGDHGDLLDVIQANIPGETLREALAEARRFLSLPEEPVVLAHKAQPKARAASPGAARRLIGLASPITGTLAETYLASRALAGLPWLEALHFHPACWYRRSRDDAPTVPGAMPAMIAAVTDLAGTVTGAHRTWMAPSGVDKAPVARPRRAMGRLLGNGVRFGPPASVMAAGEGIESTLSLMLAAPGLTSIAALSAAHLAALAFPPELRRLYVAREPDPSGHRAFSQLVERGDGCGVVVLPIDSLGADLNADLRAFGQEALRDRVQSQLLPDDCR